MIVFRSVSARESPAVPIELAAQFSPPPMKLTPPSGLAALVLILAIPAHAQSSASALSAAAPAATTPPAEAPYPDVPPLPGKGLAQHDFLYTGEFDTRKEVQTMTLVRGGKVVWTYTIPTHDETNGQLSEFSDMHRLSNGDIVYAYKTGWRKIDPSGKTIYDYKCPKLSGADGKDVLNAKGQPYYTECHSAVPVGMDRVLFMRNGIPAKLFLYNLKTGKMEFEHEVQTKYPGDVTHIHAQFRNIRMTKAGTYLLAHLDRGKVIEYDKNFKEIWSCDAPSVWQAVRLPNGNTLITGNQHAFAREIAPDGKIVWEIKNGDLADIRINSVHQAQRLANGNTVITNWTAGVKKTDWPKIVQLIEVTPDNKAVWTVNEWKDPDLGPSSCIQLLDQPGRDEAQELMR
jgi:hypothetical protein